MKDADPQQNCRRERDSERITGKPEIAELLNPAAR